MLDDMINKIGDNYSKDLIDNNLSFEERVENARMLSIINKLTLGQKIKLSMVLIDDINTNEAFAEIEKINKLIENFFSNNKTATYEEIKEKIINLPQDRIIHYRDQRLMDIYDKYCENLYKFVLKSVSLGDTDLLSQQEVINIVTEKVREDLYKLKDETSITRKLWLHAQNCNDRTSAKELLDTDLLLELYLQRCGIVVENFTKEINKAENEKKKISGKLADNRKKRLKLGSKVALATFINVMLLTAPALGIAAVCAHKYKGLDLKIESETPIGTKTEDTDTFLSDIYFKIGRAHV